MKLISIALISFSFAFSQDTILVNHANYTEYIDSLSSDNFHPISPASNLFDGDKELTHNDSVIWHSDWSGSQTGLLSNGPHSFFVHLKNEYHLLDFTIFGRTETRAGVLITGNIYVDTVKLDSVSNDTTDSDAMDFTYTFPNQTNGSKIQVEYITGKKGWASATEAEFRIIIDTTTTISDFIFPPTDITSIDVFDITGRFLFQATTKRNMQLHIKEYKKGIYLLKTSYSDKRLNTIQKYIVP